MFIVMSPIVTNLDSNHLHIIAQAVLRSLLQIKGRVSLKPSHAHNSYSNDQLKLIFTTKNTKVCDNDFRILGCVIKSYIIPRTNEEGHCTA